MKEVIAIKCPHCSDLYKYECIDFYLTDDIWFFINETDCWKCGKIYLPILNAKSMDEFVYKALQRTRM